LNCAIYDNHVSLPIYALIVNEHLIKYGVSAETLDVHPASGNHLPVKMCEFLQGPDFLERHRSALTGSHGVLIVYDRRASSEGQFFSFVLSLALPSL
jgi:hypothetical protein